uniref:Uncharacterized protein n=1 Tax=Arundo donax TaxID=35708 RepID=A0A0A9D533_ARUDO
MKAKFTRMMSKRVIAHIIISYIGREEGGVRYDCISSNTLSSLKGMFSTGMDKIMHSDVIDITGRFLYAKQIFLS